MKTKYKEEQDLIPHYEEHVEYYSSINPDRLPGILNRFGLDFDEQDVILDLGCGDGRLCKYLSEKYGCKCIGVDYSQKRIARARETCDKDLCDFHVADINLFSPKGEVDAVFAFEVLEHLKAPEDVVSAWLPHSNKGLYGSVPIDMPYKAHLQVYSTTEQVEARLPMCDVMFTDYDHYFIHCDIPRNNT